MNQQQRKFLIESIEKSTRNLVYELERSKPSYPDIAGTLFLLLIEGKLELLPNEEIGSNIVSKARGKEGRKILESDSRYGNNLGTGLKISVESLFKLPDYIQKQIDDYRNEQERIELEIKQIKNRSEGLITRITISSGKVLEALVNEVDSIGDLTLTDLRLKEITQKQLN